VSSRLAATPSQTVGPFFAIGLCRRAENELAPADDPAAVRLIGQLIDGAGVPIVDGVIEVWSGGDRRWGRCGTDAEGSFSFRLVKPAAAPGEAPRLDVNVFARGLLKHQLTRIYFPDEPEANAADPVLAALSAEDRATLVAEAEDGALRRDIRLQGDGATVFFAP
jgi:protocatechuate 3,4-dioxygenase alpha subunit